MRFAHMLISVSFALALGSGYVGCGNSDNGGAGGSSNSSGSGGSQTTPGNVDLATVMSGTSQAQGWTLDPNDELTRGSLKVYADYTSAEHDIDGTADHFWTDKHTPKAVALGAYLKSDMSLQVYLVQMNSATDGEMIYNEYVTGSDYQAGFEAVNVGDKGWIGCERDGCILVAKKGAAFLHERLNLATDLTVARTAVLDFANAVFSNF